MFETGIGNLLSWMEQVLLIASAGALLPILFRIRHPRTQIVYCHLVLAACVLLPVVEPWQHPVISAIPPRAVEGRQASAPPRVTAEPQPTPEVLEPETIVVAEPLPFWKQVPLTQLAGWLLAAGVCARLCWLLGGLWRIRRFRIESMPLYPIPESVQAASAITHADAVFCISDHVSSPVMLGWLTPVVLLPQSFLELAEEAQCGIACHELLHVSRHDWLVTLAEELIGAVLWFNPGIWMLLAQTRLAREQLVDEEVVQLTAAREPYIDALLAIARGGIVLDLAPAPLFLRKRHLTQRVHLLLKDVSISKLRLLSSYCSITAILAFAGWLGLTSFPLIGRPQVQVAAEKTTTPVAVAEQPVEQTASAAASPAPRTSEAPVSVQLPPAPGYRPEMTTGYPSVPIPADPHELVAAGARTPATPAERADALALLERAKQNNKLHVAGTPPFLLKATFFASGELRYAGYGELTETWMSGQDWRWTAKLGDYSQDRRGPGNRGYDEQPVKVVPVRVHMLREAIFWAGRGTPSSAQIRTAAVQWNGLPATCLLISGVTQPRTDARLWEEQEYCIDNTSGLLQIFSEAPGVYIVYDYDRVPFHNRVEPRQITIYVAHAQALDAQIAITDLGSVDRSLFKPTEEMIARGPGIALRTGRTSLSLSTAIVSGTVHPVMLHVTADADGNLIEQEVASASDPALVKPALEFVNSNRYHIVGSPSSQGEMYINVRFHPIGGSPR